MAVKYSHKLSFGSICSSKGVRWQDSGLFHRHTVRLSRKLLLIRCSCANKVIIHTFSWDNYSYVAVLLVTLYSTCKTIMCVCATNKWITFLSFGMWASTASRNSARYLLKINVSIFVFIECIEKPWIKRIFMMSSTFSYKFAVVTNPYAIGHNCYCGGYRACATTHKLLGMLQFKNHLSRAGLKPMQLHWAPRHDVWVDYSFCQIHLALENSLER